jgi:rare lipoprotein A
MSLFTRVLPLAAFGLLVAGCASQAPRDTNNHPVQSHGGGYYLDDGPGDHPPANLADIPDAVPKVEPLKPGSNRPYTALGKEYTPIASASGYKEKGLASWYGRRYDGKPTSSGEIYDMYAMTAAHTTLPIPSYVRVTNLNNGRSVVVRVNDRGPFHDGRIIDLSYTAAWKLDILKGVTPVEVVGIDPDARPSVLAAASPAPVNSATVTTALPPLETTVSKPAAVPATGDTFLQLGAFSSSSGADQVMQRVQERVGAGYPGIRKIPSGHMIKVQMGPFNSLAEADQAALKVEQETGIHAFRVSH